MKRITDLSIVFFRLLFAVTICLPSVQVPGQSWPTFRSDFGRSGFVEADLDASRFELQWTWQSSLLPDPAWDGPARWDAFAELKDLPAMRQYDACFHPVSDGKFVYFGSSSQDAIYCLELDSGKQSWVFVAGGPVRIAPVIHNGKILFGSDDGCVYCLNQGDGQLIWKFNPSLHAGAEQRRVLNNDRLISFFPIRTGVVVRDGVAYFASSFLPWRESYLCGVDVETGELNPAKSTFVTRHQNATLEGPMLVANGRLIVPQGRIAPLLFDQENGAKLGGLPGGGGVTIVVTEKGDVARAEGGRAARPGQVGVFRGKERVASFPRGRSIVLRKDAFYVIDRDKIFAASRKANELLWQVDALEPLEIIMVGSSLIVGCRDRIAAIESGTGKLIWETSVEGRVFGLAYAGGNLMAATDCGTVLCYRSTSGRPWMASGEIVTPSREPVPLPDLAQDDDLVHRWVFHRSGMTRVGQPVVGEKLSGVSVTDQAGAVDLRLKGNALSRPIPGSGKVEGIELQDAMFPIDSRMAENLPAKELTVEAWVRVDQPATWGGIIGCIQDDGSTEHGWLLGYNGDRFSLAIAGGKSGLTYLKADRPFRKKNWYHVAGTYDGERMNLYVNGRLSATSTSEKGPVSYAAKRFFTVGAYRDVNESFPLKGALQEIRVYSKARTASQVAGDYEKQRDDFGSLPASDPAEPTPKTFLAWGPFVRYVEPGVVEIRYGTRQACPTLVILDRNDNEPDLSGGIGNLQIESPSETDSIEEPGVFSDPAPKTQHRIRIDGLPVKRVLAYRILDGLPSERGPGEVTLSARFSLDTHFDWTTSTKSGTKTGLLKQLQNPRGMVFVFGRENQEFAKRISRESNLTVVFFADNQAELDHLRQTWIQDPSIRYGKSLAAALIESNHLPAATAQLVVAGKKATPEQMGAHRRLVRPAGGILARGEQAVWTRGKVAGAGDWTHMYGLPDNSAYGGEELAEASNRDDLVANWIGKPGPRYQTDRQNRKPAPLAANGRLFLQGQQRMIALDSYSGTILWSVESPTVLRWNVPRDSANWCADEKGVYVAAQGEARLFAGGTGEIEKRFSIPAAARNGIAGDEEIYWGYIARYRGILLGTATKSDAAYTKWWGKSQWFDTPTGGDTHVVAGDSLFALDAVTGQAAWTYQGLVLHPTITILDNRIYFIESKTAEHLKQSTRRLSIDKGQQLELVCLDPANGKTVFRRELPSFKGKVTVLYLAGGGNRELRSLVLVASEATQKAFSVSCLDPSAGKVKWNGNVRWETNHHGKHISRPAIENDLLYLRPEVLKLSDGATLKRGFPSGHGCASYTLSKNGLFSRLGETTWWDVRNDKVNRFSRVRTDCWISAIPAQGMLLSAEGGGGCSCGSWLETSIGFLPRKIDQTFPLAEGSGDSASQEPGSKDRE